MGSSLASLRLLGVLPELVNGRILVRDTSSLSDAARALLRAHRDELVAELSAQPSAAPATPLLPFSDALTLAVAHLPGMPIPTTFVLEVPGIRAAVLWTSSRSRYAAARSPEEVAFSPVEILALAGAYERDRGLPGDLAEFAARKLREPAWRVDPRAACHGLIPLGGEAWRPTWFDGSAEVPAHEMAYGVTVGRLLVHFGARLVRVEIECLGASEVA